MTVNVGPLRENERRSVADMTRAVPCIWVPCSCNAFDACDRCGGRGGHYAPEGIKDDQARETLLTRLKRCGCPSRKVWWSKVLAAAKNAPRLKY